MKQLLQAESMIVMWKTTVYATPGYIFGMCQLLALNLWGMLAYPDVWRMC